MITRFGKRFITSYLAGLNSFSKQDLAIGIADNTDYALADTNSRLGFEFYRLPADFASIDIQTQSNGTSTYAVIYQTTLPQDMAGIISEIGIYPGSRTSKNNFDDKILSDFENNLLWTQSTSPYGYADIISSPSVSPFPRIGNALIPITATSSQTKEYIATIANLDISGYSANDTIVLAYNQEDTNLSSIKIKFYSSDTDYFYTTITGAATTGNKISNIMFSTLLSSGTPNLDSIYKIGISATAKSSGTTKINLEGLRINDEDTFDPSYGLISRSVLSTPLVKVSGRPSDIEYRMEITF